MTELRVEKMVQKMEREGALRVLGGGCVLGDELSWREREMLMRLKRERTV